MSPHCPRLVTLALLAASLAPARASAEPSATQAPDDEAPAAAASPASDDEAPAAPASPAPRRPLPDFDGRPPPDPLPAQRAAWVPRTLLSPLYFVSESVIRRPLSILVPIVEHADLAERAMHFFRFGPGDRLLLAPFFSYDFGFRPNVGLAFRGRDIGTPGHSIELTGATGGRRWYAGRVVERYAVPESRVDLELSGEAITRPDGAFYGISPDVTDGVDARYHWFGTEASFALRVGLLERSNFRVRIGHRYRRFDDDVGRRRSLEEAVDEGDFEALPPGYESGYSLGFLRTELIFDSRPDRPEPGTGARLRLEGAGFIDARDGASALSFLKYEGSLTGYLDVSGSNHVLSAGTTFAFSEALRGDIPFTELPGLGGSGPLDAFTRPYLIGDSAAAFSLGYTWPIWLFLDGVLNFSLGNAFPGHLQGFGFDRLRMSGSIGIAAVKNRRQIAELLFGVGTDEFGDGPDVERLRFVLGSGRDF